MLTYIASIMIQMLQAAGNTFSYFVHYFESKVGNKGKIDLIFEYYSLL